MSEPPPFDAGGVAPPYSEPPAPEAEPRPAAPGPDAFGRYLPPETIRRAVAVGRARATRRIMAGLAPFLVGGLEARADLLAARGSLALREPVDRGAVWPLPVHEPRGAGPGGARTDADRIRLDRADDKRARKAARGR